MLRLQQWIDSCAVAISALCAVHCLALPIVMIIFPLLASSVLMDEFFHQMLLWVILPTSIVAIALARRSHPDRLVLLLVGVGMAILILGALWAHDHADPWVDKLLALLGGATLALGHLRNFRLCRPGKHAQSA